jgi:5-methylthioribose kinase
MVIANKIYSTMVTCLSEELTRIGLALRHLAPVEGIDDVKKRRQVEARALNWNALCPTRPRFALPS